MDGINKTARIVRQVVQSCYDFYRLVDNDSSIENLLILDDEQYQYLILRHGWEGKKRAQYIPVFIRIVNEKVWVEEDWTDYEIVDKLLEAGIAQEDIVLAFHHPSMRQYTEFATA